MLRFPFHSPPRLVPVAYATGRDVSPSGLFHFAASRVAGGDTLCLADPLLGTAPFSLSVAHSFTRRPRQYSKPSSDIQGISQAPHAAKG